VGKLLLECVSMKNSELCLISARRTSLILCSETNMAV
jgi:hypothetical protein